MVDILNLAWSYFGLIFIGFACGKAKGLPESGLAWMNFLCLKGANYQFGGRL
jgi:malonate transporter